MPIEQGVTSSDDEDHSTQTSDEMMIIELDERLEFGAVILDSDLNADDNSGCSNLYNCSKYNNTSCFNSSTC